MNEMDYTSLSIFPKVALTENGYKSEPPIDVKFFTNGVRFIRSVLFKKFRRPQNSETYFLHNI